MSDAGEKEKKRPASYILTTNIHRVWGVYRCCQMVLLFSEDSRQLWQDCIQDYLTNVQPQKKKPHPTSP